MDTVVGDISGGIQQHKNLSDVTLKDCCDELTRGVVEGLRRKQTPQHQLPSSPGKPDIATVFFEVHVHIAKRTCSLPIMSVLIFIYTNHTNSCRMLTFHLLCT